eukprot:Clim_evm29s232 gene=Clim_evmTU29s232
MAFARPRKAELQRPQRRLKKDQPYAPKIMYDLNGRRIRNTTKLTVNSGSGHSENMQGTRGQQKTRSNAILHKSRSQTTKKQITETKEAQKEAVRSREGHRRDMMAAELNSLLQDPDLVAKLMEQLDIKAGRVPTPKVPPKQVHHQDETGNRVYEQSRSTAEDRRPAELAAKSEEETMREAIREAMRDFEMKAATIKYENDVRAAASSSMGGYIASDTLKSHQAPDLQEQGWRYVDDWPHELAKYMDKRELEKAKLEEKLAGGFNVFFHGQQFRPQGRSLETGDQQAHKSLASTTSPHQEFGTTITGDKGYPAAPTRGYRRYRDPAEVEAEVVRRHKAEDLRLALQGQIQERERQKAAQKKKREMEERRDNERIAAELRAIEEENRMERKRQEAEKERKRVMMEAARSRKEAAAALAARREAEEEERWRRQELIERERDRQRRDPSDNRVPASLQHNLVLEDTTQPRSSREGTNEMQDSSISGALSRNHVPGTGHGTGDLNEATRGHLSQHSMEQQHMQLAAHQAQGQDQSLEALAQIAAIKKSLQIQRVAIVNHR